MLTVLVTGCDTGIGRAVALTLAARGERVVALCLGDPTDLHAARIDVQAGIDVTSDDAVVALAERLRQRAFHFDWLMSVAGVLLPDTLGAIDFAETRRQFDVNAVGPLRIVQALRDLLHRGSKVGIVSSRVGSLGENRSGGNYG